MNNKAQLLFKDGRREDITDCVRHTIPSDGTDIFYIVTKDGTYILSEGVAIDETQFADDNPLGTMRIISRYYKKINPELPDHYRNYEHVHNIKGILFNGQLCSEVKDGKL